MHCYNAVVSYNNSAIKYKTITPVQWTGVIV